MKETTVGRRSTYSPYVPVLLQSKFTQRQNSYKNYERYYSYIENLILFLYPAIKKKKKKKKKKMAGYYVIPFEPF